MKFDKESIYDNEISPLITQVIEICQREGIPFAMTFGIRDDTETDGCMLYCSSLAYGTPRYPDLDIGHFQRLNAEIMHAGKGCTVRKEESI